MEILSSLGLQSLGLVLAALIGVLVVLFAVSRAARLYHRVPPSKVMVVYGKGKTEFDAQGKPVKTGIRLVTGGGMLVWPIFEEFQFLDLNVMTIEQPRDMVYTIDGIPLNLDWVALVQIGSDEVSLLTAARAFLGMRLDAIIEVITKTLSTNNRAIVGQMTVEELHRDRDAFVQKVQQLAADEMASMGLSVKQMGVRDITDQEGYFQAMAAPKIAAIKRDATIAQAEADREARVKSAQAKLEAEQAEVGAQTTIIERREALQLREVEQTQAVAMRQAEADRQVQEKRALVVAKEQEVQILVPARAQADAQRIKAEGDKVSAEIDAQKAALVKATQAEGDANAARLQAQGQADAAVKTAEGEAVAIERKAIATAKQTRETKEAEAAGTRATLTAEAEGNEAKLKAQAAGQRELADAAAAQGEINLRQSVAQWLIDGDVKKAEALATALAGIGGNVRIVQMGGNGSSGQNPLFGILQSVPELATLINEKTLALTGGQGIESVLERALTIVRTAGRASSSVVEPVVEETKEVSASTGTSKVAVEEATPVVTGPQTPVGDQSQASIEDTGKKQTRRRPGSKTQ